MPYRHKLHLTKKHFWLPNVDKNVKNFVTAFSTCAQNKNSTACPLPSPSRPWTHSPSTSPVFPCLKVTFICNIISHFSKTAHFIPLAKLPSVFETAQIMIKHVFCLYGIPQDIFQTETPIYFPVRKAFCLGVTASLTSRYHP